MSGNEIIRNEILAYSRNPRRNTNQTLPPIQKRKIIAMIRVNYEKTIEVSSVRLWLNTCIRCFSTSGVINHIMVYIP